MSYPTKLPKLFSPGFDTARKPTVPVEIDWDNPLTRGLVFLYLVGSDIDIIFNEQLYTRTGSISPVDKELCITSGTHKLDFHGLSGDNFTAAVKSNQVSSATCWLMSIASKTESASGNVMVIECNPVDGFVDFYVEDNLITASTGGWDYDNSGLFIGRYDGSTSYVEKSKNGVVSKTASGAVSATLGPDKAILFNHQPLWGNNTDPGISFGIVWDRSLSDAEIASFRKNPYQILKPKVDTLLITGAAAAPAEITEIPNALHNLDHQYAVIMAHKLNGVLQQ